MRFWSNACTRRSHSRWMNPPSFTTTCSPPYYGNETLIHLQAVGTNLHFIACWLRKNEYFKFLKYFIHSHYPSSCFMKFVSAQHENLALDSTKRWNLITDFNNLLDLLNKKATALIPLDMRPTLTKCNNFHCFKRMACCQELHRDFQFPVFSMVSFCLWDHLEPNYIV